MDAMERLRRRLRVLLDERLPGGKIRQKRLCAFLQGRGDKSKSEAWLSNILKGRRGVRLKDLDGIADFFAMPPGELIRNEGDALWELTPLEMAVIKRWRRLDYDDKRSMLTFMELRHLIPLLAKEPPPPK